MMQIKTSKEEFCLDFFNMFPPVGAMTARVITSPGHIKRMVKALQVSLKKYEDQFGAVEEASEPEKPPMGFSTK